uniref:Aromatic-L-amino-acid decarboxylase n=1 Tax=Parastrongyloides trichosuri TaxID=131310 RepID=A0A0N5A471_PARTI
MDYDALSKDFPKFVEAISLYLSILHSKKIDNSFSKFNYSKDNLVNQNLYAFLQRVFGCQDSSFDTINTSNFEEYLNYIVEFCKQKSNHNTNNDNIMKYLQQIINKIYLQFLNTNRKNNLFNKIKNEISYPSIIAEILMTAVGSPGFTWQASPLVTETELLMCDWIGDSLNIPSCFFNQSSEGNGAFHYTIDECLLLSIICAKSRKISNIQGNVFDEKLIGTIETNIIGRTSYDPLSDCHSYFIKHDPKHNKYLKGYIFGPTNCDYLQILKNSGVRIDILETLSQLSLKNLINTIVNDKSILIFPFIVIFSIDKKIDDSLNILKKLISFCKREDIWIAVNLSNITENLFLDKYEKLNLLLKDVDSIIVEIQNVFLTCEPCTVLWMKNYKEAENSLSITPTYLRHSNQGMIADLRHISFGFSKRPRGIRLWLIISTFGIEGLKNYHKDKNKKNTDIKLIEPLNCNAFSVSATKAFNFIINYWKTIKNEYLPNSNSPPMTIFKILTPRPPEQGNSIDFLLSTYKNLLNHTTHWLHPNFLAYFPCHTHYLCVLGDLFAAAFGYQTNSELCKIETEVIENIGKEMNLDESFWKREKIEYRQWFYGSASEGTFKSVLMARELTIMKFKKLYNLRESNLLDFNILDNLEISLLNHLDEWDPINDSNCMFLYDYLIGYTTMQAHSSVEKAYLLANVRMRKLPVFYDKSILNFTIAPDSIEKALEIDRCNCMVPFIITFPIGSTSTCGIDLPSIYAPVAKEEGMWVHCDSAYLGGFFLLHEYQYLLKGFLYVDSFVINLHKSGGINQDASMLFTSNKYASLKDLNTLGTKPRINRGIKIWFLQKIIGFETIREMQRKQIKCAQLLESLLHSKDYLEVVTKQMGGLVCFKLKYCSNEDNEKVFNIINNIDRRIHITESHTNNIHFMRISINNPQMTEDEINDIFKIICENSEKFLRDKNLNI